MKIIEVHDLCRVTNTNKLNCYALRDCFCVEYKYRIYTLTPRAIVDNFFDFAQEIKYSAKSFFSILSGFDRWEEKFDGVWCEVEPDDNDDDENYYVCARYKNARHIPLPIIEDWNPSENKLQKFAIKIAKSIVTGRGKIDFCPTRKWAWGKDDGWFHIGPISYYR